LKVRPLPFVRSWDFFPKTDARSIVEINACFGSIPYYLSIYDAKLTLEKNLVRSVMGHDSRLYEELNILLGQELREPDIYKRILRSIASGKTRAVEIGHAVDIQTNDLSKYLNRLILLGMIKKESSITDINGRRPLYSIDDNFINFWFTFCEPYKSNLEIGQLEGPLYHLQKNFNTYVGRRFEELVRRELIHPLVPFSPSTVGRFWKKETEIDIVALDQEKENGVFFEVKWSKIDPEKELRLLEEKVEQFPWKLISSKMMIVAKELKYDHPDCIDLGGLIKKVSESSKNN
jgi:AAA+ ATPase superfamily predicted ATPase